MACVWLCVEVCCGHSVKVHSCLHVAGLQCVNTCLPTVFLIFRKHYHVIDFESNRACACCISGESLASDLLLIGKSINFVRACCGDTEWVMDAATTATFESAGRYHMC